VQDAAWHSFARKFAHLIGVEFSPVSHAEKWISGLGGFVAIFCVIAISSDIIEGRAAVLVIASMGASTVLAFAVPHGPLSQPWAVIGGNVISAVVGVACYKLIPNVWIGAGAAVGLAILAMHYLKCVHPPGGATALLAVIGGSNIHALGFFYPLTPVLVNASLIVLIAVIFNWPYSWRRYPAALATHHSAPHPKSAPNAFTHGDFEYAMQKLDSFVDVTEDDLSEIYSLAQEHALRTPLGLDQIRPGAYYSNGLYGDEWAVRQIRECGATRPEEDLVRFQTIAGKDRRTEGTCTREDFSRWAQHEVLRIENTWRRVAQGNFISPEAGA
jgi:CBS domain-containing membrane protein